MNIFELKTELLQGGQVYKYSMFSEGIQLEYRQVLTYWQECEDFRRFFANSLSDTPFSAFRWETPGVSKETLQQPFECVVVNSPELDRGVDMKAFKDYILKPESAVSVENQSGDALLIIPTVKTAAEVYVHLATFLRGASEQKYEIWSLVSQAMLERLQKRKVYLSTAGGGVAWLHIRLDNRPKYYAFQAYRQS